jgi:hypothetical protein
MPENENRTEFGFTRTVCICDQCVAYCSYFPGNLIPSDIHVISSHLGYDDIVQFALENLLASPGATLIAGGELIQVPTLTPKRAPGGACKFLQDSRCVIHAQSPYGCSFFDHSQSHDEANARSLAGLLAIAEDWSTDSLYAQLWRLLHSLGHIGPSPTESRERMHREMQQKKK